MSDLTGTQAEFLAAMQDHHAAESREERFWQRSDRLDDHTPAGEVISLADHRRRKLRSLPYLPPSAA